MMAPSSIWNAYFASSSVKPLGRMTWKSAPHGRIVPWMPGPRTSPPRIGIIRRVPQPRSPAMIGVPTFTARLKTYLVASCGAITLSNHPLRQPGRQQWKQNQNHEANEVGHHEGQHADEDRGHVDV